MPKPHEGEREDDYISRCMGSDEMNADYPEQDQRAAVCYSYWREHRKGVLLDAAGHLEAAAGAGELTPEQRRMAMAGHRYHAARLRGVLPDD